MSFTAWLKSFVTWSYYIKHFAKNYEILIQQFLCFNDWLFPNTGMAGIDTKTFMMR